MKGIYDDLRNVKVKTDTILILRKTIKDLKAKRAKLTIKQLQDTISETIRKSGATADVKYIENSGSLMVKHTDIIYTWDVSGIIKP